VKTKHVLVLLLLLLVLSSYPASAMGVAGVLDQAELAASEPEKPNGDTASGNAGGEIKDEGGPFERIIAGFIEFPVKVVKAIGDTIGLKHINILVFGADPGNGTPWHDHFLWNESEAKFIRTVYWAFASICLPFFLFVIISTGFKLIYGAANPGAREEAISSIWRWFAVMVMVLAVPLITDLVLSLSGVLTDAIRIAFEHVSKSLGLGVSLGEFSSGVFKGDIGVKTGSVIGTALVKVFFAFAWLWFNIIYFIRKVVLSVMVCFTPVAGLFWAINKNVPAVAIWFGELGSNALMPVAHAIVLCVILGLTDLKNVSKDGSWFYVLIAIYLLMPLAETIRNSVQSLFTRWAGVDESGIASRATMAAFGFGGIMSLGRLAGTLTAGSTPKNVLSNNDDLTGIERMLKTGASPGAASFAGVEVPGGFAGASVSENIPGYRMARSGLYVPSDLAGTADGGFTATGGADAGAGEVLFPASTGGQVPKENPSEQKEKPVLGRVADGAVNVSAALVGGTTGWMVKAAAGAVPGMASAGQALGNTVDRGFSAGARAIASHIVLESKMLDDLRNPDPNRKRYFSGQTWKDVHNVVKASYGVAGQKMNVSDLMYASTLEEAVKNMQPKYSDSKKKLA